MGKLIISIPGIKNINYLILNINVFYKEYSYLNKLQKLWLDHKEIAEIEVNSFESLDSLVELVLYAKQCFFSSLFGKFNLLKLLHIKLFILKF